MKFKSNKYRNIQITCGDTLFKFDVDGVCEVPHQGYCFSSDVQLLIDRGWLEKVEDLVVVPETEPVVVAEISFEEPPSPEKLEEFKESWAEVVDKSENKLENIIEEKPVKPGKKKDKKEV